MNSDNIYVRASIVFGLGLAATASGLATPRVATSAEMLTRQADLIVLATVLGIIPSASRPVWGLRVESVVKGNIHVGDTVTAVWPSPILHDGKYLLGSSNPPLRGLFFLRANGPGGFQIIPVISGADDVSEALFRRQTGLVGYSSIDTVLDKVLRELAMAGTQGDPWALPGVLGIVLRVNRPPATRDVCGQLASAPIKEANAVGIQCLLALGDIQTLSTVIANQDVLFQSDAGLYVSRFVGEFFTNTDATAIAALGDITRSSRHSELQEAAARALARVHTKSSLPYLATLLTSSDIKLVTFGVGGLAMFANNVPIGTYDTNPGPYRTEQTIAHSAMDERLIQANRSYYVDFWQQWWQRNQAQLTNPAP